MSASPLRRSRRGVVVLATAATLAAVGLGAVSRPAAAAIDPAHRPQYAIQLANSGLWEESTGFNKLLRTIDVQP